jgi:hypothetical protein
MADEGFFVEEADKLTLQESVAKLRQIHKELRVVAANLHGKLEMLDSEPQLHSSLDKLRQDVEARASDLEAEVKRLRQDLKNVKDLLGNGNDKKVSTDS